LHFPLPILFFRQSFYFSWYSKSYANCTVSLYSVNTSTGQDVGPAHHHHVRHLTSPFHVCFWHHSAVRPRVRLLCPCCMCLHILLGLLPEVGNHDYNIALPVRRETTFHAKLHGALSGRPMCK
jgi:hypothetical protein